MLFAISLAALLLSPISRMCLTRRVSGCYEEVFKNCSCFFFGKMDEVRAYNCSKREFFQIPSFLKDQKLEKIILHGNKISKFPDIAVFPESLKFLDLSSNRFIDFSRHVFAKLYNLKVLNVSNNYLFSEKSNLPTGTFRDLRNLKQLYIQRNIGNNSNRIINHTDAFVDLLKLETLQTDAYITPIFSHRFQSLTKLITLDLSGLYGFCHMSSLNSSAFKNVPFLQTLILSKCKIKEIHKGTFLKLQFLRELDISFNNELTFDVFPNISEDLLSTNITTLHASKLHCTFGIGKKVFKYQLVNLRHTKIRNLFLDDNKIEVFEYGALSMFPENLSFFSMRRNRLIFDTYLLDFVNLENLEELDVSFQHFTFDPTENLDFLDCDDTKTCLNIFSREKRSVTSEIEFYIPRRLFKVNFPRSSFSFEYFGIWRFNRNNNLEYMDISGNKASKIIGPIIGLTRLKFVNMSQIQCFELGSFVFSHLEQLEFLDMNGNDLGGMLQNEHDGSLFSFLHNLKVLNLSTNGINHLPEKIFTGLTSLETLVLRRNSLKEIKTDLFFMQNLSFIDLSENSLSELSVSFMNDIEFLSRSKKVSLSLHPNPLRCACDTMKMLYWLKRMKSFIKDFNYLTCSLYEGNANVKGLSDLEDIIITLEKECNSYLWLIFGTLSLIIFVSAIIVSVIIHRYRWKIRYFFYISRNKYKMFKRYTGDAHLSRFRYDAFVSYSDENKEFVLDEMIRELEEVSQLRLCLSGRDFRPGVSIAENITRSINKSKKTIVIMSVDYLLSYWCMYELNMARMESLYSRSDQDVLMMIVLEKVAFQNAPHVVLELINNNSFLEYPDDQHGKILFWEKIRETFA